MVKLVFKVDGKKYEVWSDFVKRGTYAKDMETGEIKCLRGGGYLSSDFTIRKIIRTLFS